MASLPGSPLVSRKQNRFVRAPITPQQHPRHPKRQVQSQQSCLQANSPQTPGTPYTPLSLSSISTTSTTSSALVTPSNITRTSKADKAENWRVKGNLLSSPRLDSSDLEDDEDDEDDFMARDDASASLRVRSRVQSYVPPSAPPILRASSRPHGDMHSPLTQRSIAGRRPLLSLKENAPLAATPPRNPILAHQLRLRGSVTDPPSRAANSFTALSHHPDLFNIAEMDQEDMENTDEDDITTNPDDENSYYDDPFEPAASSVPIPPFFAPGAQIPFHQYAMPIFGGLFPQNLSSGRLSPRTETPPPNYVVLSMNSQEPERVDPNACSVCGVAPVGEKPTLAILYPCTHPLCSGCLTSALNIVGEKDMQCAVCKDAVDDFKLVNVSSAANKSKVVKELRPSRRQPLTALSTNVGPQKVRSDVSQASPFDSPLMSKKRVGARLSTPPAPKENHSEPAFDLSDTIRKSVLKSPIEALVVLRIDNVPWDITPPMIIEWLEQSPSSISHVHVLLDRKGKTLSHAFLEVKGEDCAKRILRGEVEPMEPGATSKKRSGLLGKGRRARGVTITRSGMDELMHSLFPTWPGNFTQGSGRPTLAGMRHEFAHLAMERPLISEGEMTSLLKLIRDGEESPFLKVPTLPFYVLSSLLSRFPVDTASRVFWNIPLRDLLFETSVVALETLVKRIDQEGKTVYKTEGILDMVLNAALSCDVFATEQKARLRTLAAGSTGNSELDIQFPSSTVQKPAQTPAAGAPSPVPPMVTTPAQPYLDIPALNASIIRSTSSPSGPVNGLAPSVSSVQLVAKEAALHVENDNSREIETLAQEFGVEKDVVLKLMERLGTRITPGEGSKPGLV